MSRVFDEVMGLGNFADSSRGSATSSKSGGQDEPKGVDQTSGQEEQQPIEEEELEEEGEDDSSCSRKDEKMDKEEVDSSHPRIASPSPDPQPSFNMGTSKGGRVGSGAPVFDDALDGLPSFVQEEDDEDWHFALPLGTIEDADVDKAGRKSSKKNSEAQRDASASEPKGGEEEEEEEQEEEQEERAGSTGSANTSHSSQDNSRGNHSAHKTVFSLSLQTTLMLVKLYL